MYRFNAKKIAQKYFDGEITKEILLKRLSPAQLKEVMLVLKTSDLKESVSFKKNKDQKKVQHTPIKEKIKQLVYDIENKKIKIPEVNEKKFLRIPLT